jgi:hypothetical protein
VVWAVSADFSSNRLSFIPISGTDGIITTSLITSATLTPRTVGTAPVSVFVYRDTSGVVWAVSADFSSNRLSFIPISGTDGIITTSLITSATLTPRTVGNGTRTASLYRSSDGVVWSVNANQSSNSLSFIPVSGTDGIITTSLITSATLTSRGVGSLPFFGSIYRDLNGVVWAINANYGPSGGAVGLLYFIPISSANGIINAALIASATPTIRSAGNNSIWLSVYRDLNNVTWAASADNGSSRLSFLPISSSPVSYNAIDALRRYFLSSNNVAEIDIAVTSLEFITGTEGSDTNSIYFVFNRVFAFNYSGNSANPSGTLASGNTIRLTTATADISNITITIASGSTFRLGKKPGPYSLNLAAQSGSTIEVYPDSDRASSAPLNLRGQSIASGTTINATSGTATVLVDSVAGIAAGSGVTLQEPQIRVVAANFANGVRTQVSHRQIFTIASTAINTTTDVLTLGNDSNGDAANFRTSSPNTLVRFSLSSGATIPTSTPQIIDGGLYYWRTGGQLSITEGGAAINFASQGSGNFILVAETELNNAAVSGGSGYSLATTRSNNAQIRVKAAHWSELSGVASSSTFFDQVFAWSSTSGISILDTVNNAAAASQDAIHEQIVGITSLPLEGPIKDATGVTITSITPANSGAAVTGLALALEGVGKIQMNATDVDGILAWQDLYLWGCYVRATEAGIRLASGSTFAASNIFNYVMSNLEFNNPSSTTLAVVGGVGTSSDGSSLVSPTTTGSIVLNALSQGTGAIVSVSGSGSFNPATDPVIVGSIQANAITPTAIAANAITAAKIAPDALTEIRKDPRPTIDTN